MNERDRRRSLRDVELDQGAEGRVWEVVSAAYRAREPVPARRNRRRFVIAVAAAVVAVAAITAALTPPGRAVVRSVREAIGIETPVAERATLARLPIDRSLLVDTASGAWLVRPTGALRRLGDYQQTTWSPRGLFVAAVHGNELRALEPNGTIRWRLVRPAELSSPRWSSSGFRIAYKQARTVRVVAGDGTGDTRVATDVPSRTAALDWQPATETHTLAYADRRGRITLLDTDRLKPLWMTEPARQASELCFTGDGLELVVLRPQSVSVLNAQTGALLTRIPIPPGSAAIACSDLASGRFALAHPAVGSADQTVVLLANTNAGQLRTVFRGPGRIDTLVFAGSRLLAAWPSADQWLFLPLESGGRISAVNRIRSLFGADDAAGATISDVCCDRR